jgi:hypothetical protein
MQRIYAATYQTRGAGAGVQHPDRLVVLTGLLVVFQLYVSTDFPGCHQDSRDARRGG